MTIDEFDAWVALRRWVIARTMTHAPHQYTLRRDGEEGFAEAVTLIRSQGRTGFWRMRRFIYLERDGWLYWTMGAPVEETILINRARVEESGVRWADG